jgi:oligopeptide/dipeptide ABC transporter ATP-binding protein
VDDSEVSNSSETGRTSDESRDEIILPGEVPSPLNPPPGCRFHPRCNHAMDRCASVVPVLQPAHGRDVACHLFDA